MSDFVEQELQTLYTHNQPDAAFADQLEQHLRTLHSPSHQAAEAKPQRIRMPQARFTRRIAAVAASFLIAGFLFTTVPPLRGFAQSVIDFFIPGEGYFAPGTENTYADVTTVETIAAAEALANIDALEWVSGGFRILHIGAAEGYIAIAYERVDEHTEDRGVLMHVSKWRIGTYREQLPISPAAEIIDTTVNGQAAQFAAGYWFGAEPEWTPEHYRNLRWQDDTFNYSLQVAAPFADTLEDVIAVAEALKER